MEHIEKPAPLDPDATDPKLAAIGHLRDVLQALVDHADEARRKGVAVDADRTRWQRLVDDAAHALSATSGRF